MQQLNGVSLYTQVALINLMALVLVLIWLVVVVVVAAYQCCPLQLVLIKTGPDHQSYKYSLACMHLSLFGINNIFKIMYYCMSGTLLVIHDHIKVHQWCCVCRYVLVCLHAYPR